MEPKSGVVYIAQRLEGWPGDTEFYGHWEVEGPDTGPMVEGPGWDTAEDAITWGRERAPTVIIRVGRQPWQQHYSAGDVFPELLEPPRNGLLPWPPGSAI
jgi:hypothetical protein